MNEEPLAQYMSMEEWDTAATGWFYDPALKLGTVFVKTIPLSLDVPFEIVVDKVYGTKENEETGLVSVYPNPTSGLLNVQSSQDQIQKITVYDHQGRVVNDSVAVDLQGNKAGLSLIKLSDGIYYIEVTCGNATVKRKVTLIK